MIYFLSVILTINVFSSYTWKSIASSGVRAYCHTVAYDPTNDLFFIMGGDSTGYETNMDLCLAFDPKNNTWDTRQPMYTAKRGHSASYRDGFIHVLCGSDNYGNKLTYHEVYDIGSDSWDLAAPAPLPVTYPGAVTWRDSLVYLVGGYDVYHDARTEVYYYNPATNAWVPATSLPRPLQGGGVKIKGDSIFIVGGADGFSYYSEILFGVINQADPSEIDWSWGNPLPISENARNGFAIKNNKLFMIGGAFDMGINKAWEYDILTETWTSLPDYPTNHILRDNIAERRDGPDSSGIIYCFMGDTSVYSSIDPTDECFRLIRIADSSGIEEEIITRKNSISINNTINFTNEIAINYNIAEICDLKIHIYDLLGRQVFSHLEKNISTGSHQFTINDNFKNGIYFIKIEAGPTVKNAKVILLR